MQIILFNMSKATRQVPYKIDKNTIKNFDEILNCVVWKQYTDTGFIDQDKLVIKPRSPFAFQVLPTNKTWRASDMFFYVDKTWTLRAYRVVNTTTNGSREYQLQYANVTTSVTGSFTIWTWTDLLFIPSSVASANVKFYFTTVDVPVLNSWTPTLYSVSWATSVVDNVKKNWSDPETFLTAPGKILLINDQNYTGLYANITSLSGSNEYSINWSGAIVPFTSGASYYILDRIAPAIRLTSSEWIEVYFDGITALPYLSTLSTNSLRKSLVLQDNQYLTKTVWFGNSLWTFNNWTLYQTKWFPWNPFYYSFTSGNKITDRNITGIYVYRNRIIAYWVDFIYAFKQNWEIEKLSKTVWVRDDAIFETGDDLYIFSTDRKIISINELASGTLFIRDISEQLSNYTTTFDADCFIGADNDNIYIGWSSGLTSWFVDKTTLLVFNLMYKYWSVYIVPAVCWSFTYKWVIYFTDRFSNSHRVISSKVLSNQYFSLNEQYPSSNWISSATWFISKNYLQNLASRWDSQWNMFTLKAPYDIKLVFENVPTTQSAWVTTFKWLDWKIWSTAKKIFNITQISGTSSFGTWVTGAEITWWTNNPADTLLPIIKTVPTIKDSCYASKLVIESVWENWFYLDSIVHIIETNSSTNDYVSPNSTN